MTIEAAIYTRLSSSTALTAEVGTRIYPVVLPQSCTYPAVMFLKISETYEHAMGSDANPKTARIQVGAFGKTYDDARDVNTQIKASLSRYRATVGDIVIHDIFFEGEFDAFIEDTEIYHIPAEFVVFYT